MDRPSKKEITSEIFSIMSERWIRNTSTTVLKQCLTRAKKLLEVLEDKDDDLTKATETVWESTPEFIKTSDAIVSQAIPTIPQDPPIKKRRTRSDKGTKREKVLSKNE